jgi:hypothetical protein
MGGFSRFFSEKIFAVHRHVPADGFIENFQQGFQRAVLYVCR